MFYAAQFSPDPGGGFVVTFRDIPEAIAQGDTFEEALHEAEAALVTAMEFYFEDHRAVPAPSAQHEGEHPVCLPPSVVAKVLLLNEQIAQGVSNAELARRMGTRQQEMQRITSLSHVTKIDTIDRALRALGKELYMAARTA